MSIDKIKKYSDYKALSQEEVASLVQKGQDLASRAMETLESNPNIKMDYALAVPPACYDEIKVLYAYTQENPSTTDIKDYYAHRIAKESELCDFQDFVTSVKDVLETQHTNTFDGE